jgi:hypothetical protein
MAFNMAARAAHPKNKTPTDCKWFREDLITYEVGEYNLIRVSSHFDCNPVTFLISLISLGNFGTPQPVSQIARLGGRVENRRCSCRASNVRSEWNQCSDLFLRANSVSSEG